MSMSSGNHHSNPGTPNLHHTEYVKMFIVFLDGALNTKFFAHSKVACFPKKYSTSIVYYKCA